MIDNKGYACVICGSEEVAPNWFLVSSSQWQDKLSVMHWHQELAGQAGLHAACSPWHVEHLVVHWMTTGSLDYPFARFRPGTWSGTTYSARNSRVRTQTAMFIGELTVDRGNLEHILVDDPYALTPVLDALIRALEEGGVTAADELTNELCLVS
jgi:hypothetical protein